MTHALTKAPSSATAALAVALLCFAAFFAAPAGAADDDVFVRVGRVADFGGELFYAPENRGEEWEKVGLNYPIASGDNLWVSGEGRAEVDFGVAQMRLAGDTNVHVSRLEDRQLALFVAEGRIILRLRVLEPGDSARIDTPHTQITLSRPGLYRIDVSQADARSVVSVREGEAQVAFVNGLQQLLPGQVASVVGDPPQEIEVRNGTGYDGFDTWSATRDRYYERARSSPYVSPQMVGRPDLDQYGQWTNYQDYGPVWFPNDVPSDWAPYRYGYWTNVADYGPTWVDYAPWGYAPFHYGRWANFGGRWGWCPGAYVARPVWAPALVAWYGGSGWGFSASYGSPVYGWVPLGWRDPYVPRWTRCGSRCYTTYNRPYAVNLAERPNAPATTYTNWGVPGAITAVNGATFATRKPVQANRVAVPGAALAAAPALALAPQVKPALASSELVHAGNGVPAAASTQRPASSRVYAVPPARVIPAPNPAAGAAQDARQRQASSPAPRASPPATATTSAPPAAWPQVAPAPAPAPRAAAPASSQTASVPAPRAPTAPLTTYPVERPIHTIPVAPAPQAQIHPAPALQAAPGVPLNVPAAPQAPLVVQQLPPPQAPPARAEPEAAKPRVAVPKPAGAP
jgi:hypothetical protein